MDLECFKTLLVDWPQETQCDRDYSDQIRSLTTALLHAPVFSCGAESSTLADLGLRTRLGQARKVHKRRREQDNQYLGRNRVGKMTVDGLEAFYLVGRS